MQCNAVSLVNFRNIESASVRFCPGVNVLYGNNAQGKTNMLEAIYFAAIGRSFRSLHAKECISFGKESAFGNDLPADGCPWSGNGSEYPCPA